MKKILIFSILLSSCSLLDAATNTNNINTSSINKIGEKYYNKANYTTSVDAFRITEKERDDFVNNYNKYPFLSSTNANLLFKSLSNKAYNNYNEILKEYVFFYFSEDEFGMQNIIDDIIELDSVKDDKSLIKALIWAVVDNYIRSLKKCNTDNLKTIIIDTLGQFADNNINKDYIETIINNQNKINELTRQLNFEINKCNLYKVITSIIIGVNKIAKLHEKRIYTKNGDKSPKKLQCIYTLSNGNAKCSLMSTWELIRTILIQSIGEEYYSKLKNTDFAKFDIYLCNLFYSNYNRKINKNKNNINYLNENNYDEHLEMYNLTLDRTGKSNIEGGRIDLISELLLWDANNKWNETISNEDNIRRRKTLELLKQAQDSNMNYNATNAITIILNIFPELKQYIGNTVYDENDKRIGYSNKDVMSTQSERFANELDKYKNDPRYNEPYKPKKKYHNTNKRPLESFLNNKNSFFIKENLKDNSKETFGIGIQRLLKRNNSEPFINNKINNNRQAFSNDIKPVLKRNKSALFMKDKKIFKRYNFRTPDGTVNFMDNDFKINTNTPYILFQYLQGSVEHITEGHDFLASYDNNGKLIIYELVGIQLGNDKHGVCFAKKGNTNNSWCGVDSNRNANDNNYTLEDIKYQQELGNNNTYLAKVYANKTECNNNVLDIKKNKKDGSYLAQLLLYKKLSSEEL